MWSLVFLSALLWGHPRSCPRHASTRLEWRSAGRRKIRIFVGVLKFGKWRRTGPKKTITPNFVHNFPAPLRPPAAAARQLVDDWVKAEEAELAVRYERELMNPKEALSLGSISQIVMPSDLRQVLAENLGFYLRHYQPEPLQSVQREFH